MVYKFGVHEVDSASGEVRRNGVRIRLQEKPFQILLALLEKPGEIVTREELQDRVWPDTAVDIEHSLSTAIKKLRDALEDSADNPRFVETRPGRGYRFIAPVSSPGSAETAPVLGQGIALSRPWMIAVGAVVLISLVVVSLLTLSNGNSNPQASGSLSLAVLPLKHLPENPDQDYFSEGMTEALITELGRIKNLRVISRQSVTPFKDSGKTISEIAETLDVDMILEGSVFRVGSRVRITTQLIWVSPEEHIWTESYERDIADVLTLQREVSQAVASEIREVAQALSSEIQLALVPDEIEGPVPARSVNPEAFDIYLKARFMSEKNDYETLPQSVALFEEAISRDPEYAPAHAGLAVVYARMNKQAEAEASSRRALELDPSSSIAYRALGLAKMMDYQWDDAEKYFRKSLQFNRGDSVTLHSYASLLALLGRHDEAISMVKKAVELNPLSVGARMDFGFYYYMARRYEEAIQRCELALELEPENAAIHSIMAASYVELRKYDEALEEFEIVLRFQGDSDEEISKYRSAYEKGGIPAFRRKRLEHHIRQYADGKSSAYSVGVAYAMAGELDSAFHHLEQAYQENPSAFTFFKVNPQLDPLRGDPRFDDLLKRMNLSN